MLAVAMGSWQGRDYPIPGGVLASLTIALFISGWRLPDPPNDDD